MRKHLKIQILIKYDTQQEFAMAIRKSPDWVSKVVHAKVNPNEHEKRLIMNNLQFENADMLFMDWDHENVKKESG